jgi:hypothetical protein
LGKGDKALVIGQGCHLGKELDTELTAIGAPSEEVSMLFHGLNNLLRGRD